MKPCLLPTWISFLPLITLLVVVLSVPSVAQSATDTTARQTVQKNDETYHDENGDGVKDKPKQQRKGRRQQKDRFIDSNGDGICDSRETGLGFRWGKTEQRMGNGKPGKGRRK